jgi:hypothetical protein
VDNLILKIARDEGMYGEHSFLVQLVDQRMFRVSVEKI